MYYGQGVTYSCQFMTNRKEKLQEQYYCKSQFVENVMHETQLKQKSVDAAVVQD